MRKIYLLFSIIMSALIAQAQQIQFTGEEEGTISLSCEVTDWTHPSVSTPLGEAWLPSCKGSTPLLRAGTPEVQKLTAAVIVDDEAAMEVEVVSYHFTEYQDVLVAPSKGNLLRTVDPSTVPYVFGEAYNQDEFFPGSLAVLDEAYILHNARGQAVHFYPFQYNPITKVLRVYDHIAIEVHPTDVVGENPLPSNVDNKVNALFNDVYNDQFVNYTSNQDRYEQIGEIGNLLVITDASYMEALQPWVQWKKEKGIPTEVVDVATITAEVGNDITNIDNFVSNYYNNNGLTYLVLVGDEDQVPTLLVNNSGGQGYCDACYGYINGNDHYSEIFISRLIVHNEGELVPVIDKILEYEKNPYMAADWYSTAVGIGSNEGDGIGDDNEADWQHQNDLKVDLLGYTYDTIYELYDGNHTASSPTGGTTADAAGSPSSSTLTNIINTGCSLINYTGHGSHTSIVTTSYTNTQVNALTNQHRFPYFIIVGCCVGDFDDDDASGETFGEAWLKSMDGTAPAGGIGGAFSSVYQSWAPPMEGQDEMNNVIAEITDIANTRHTIGSIHFHGCASMNDEYGGGGNDMTDTWHIFGDATVQLRTDFPTEMVVDHPATLFLGMSQLTVDCNTDGAMVGLTIDGEIIGMGIVSGGSVTISFDPIVTPGTVLVTVTSFNKLPYQGEVNVLVAEGPYVIDQDETIDDSMGNGNGLADFNESILLDVSLNNVGIETAYGVTAVISTMDPAITITDDTHYFGDILEGEIPFAAGAYAFDVADGIEDQHSVLFNMLITDQDNNSWEMTFHIVLNAPVLVCPADITIDDSDGNNNGRIDSGEIVNVIVSLGNNGHANSTAATAYLSTTSPYLDITPSSVDAGVVDTSNPNVISYTVTASADIPDGTLATLDFSATAGMYSTECSFEKILDVIIEDWETGTLGSFPWQLAGDANWFTTSYQPYEGAYCLQSGDIGNGDNSILKLDLVLLEAGEITFSAKVSSEAQYDFLNFKIDNTQLNAWSGELDWTVFTYPVSAGSHTFRWTYIKDAFCCQDGEDAGWVDDIILPPYDSSINVNELVNGNSALHVYPNPANDMTSVEFTSTHSSHVVVEVVDAMGRSVMIQDRGTVNPGSHKFNLDVQSLAPGVYTILLRSGMDTQVARMIRK